MKYIYIIIFFIITVSSFTNTKFLKNKNIIITYFDNTKKIQSIETTNVKNSFKFKNQKFNLMESSLISFDIEQNINLEKGIMVFSNNKNDYASYSLLLDNKWGGTQFLRIETNNFINDLSSDAKIIYFYENKEWILNSKIHYLFEKDKKYYYGFFIPYSLYLSTYKINADIKLLSNDKQYLRIKFENEVKSKEWEKQKIKFSPKKSKELKSTDKSKYQDQRKKRFDIWDKNSTYLYLKNGFIYPIEDTNYLSSEFGLIREWRLSNNKLYSTDTHLGIDYAYVKGTPVYASADGIIRYAEIGEYVGNMVIIDHGLGVFSNYMHLDSFNVKVGDIVKKGDMIARLGMTGAATGPHLHWELRIYGIPVDPRVLLNIEKIFE